jgi:glycerophosphodiester phosphodiesterase
VIVDSVLRVRKGLQGPNQDVAANGIEGAALAVPSHSVPTPSEVSEALNALDVNGHTAKPADLATTA